MTGKPSPVYRARLDHAKGLYERGIAPLIITLGGPGGDAFTEGGVGEDYLMGTGIPESEPHPAGNPIAAARRNLRGGWQ